MTTNTDPVRAHDELRIQAALLRTPEFMAQFDPEKFARQLERIATDLASAPPSAPLGVECDPAAIGAAFLAVLGDPAVSWRTMPDVDRFTSRVAEAAALAQQPAAVGMTKRELFTIAAMHTMRAGDYAKWEHLAQDAVSLADATLAALAAQRQGGA